MDDEKPLWVRRSSLGIWVMLLAVAAVTAVAFLPNRREPGIDVGRSVAVFVAATAAFGWGLLMVRVVAYPDWVLVRNYDDRRRVRRSRVDRVEVGPVTDGYQPGTYVWLRLRGGDRVRVDALSTPVEGERGRRVAERRAAALRSWLGS